MSKAERTVFELMADREALEAKLAEQKDKERLELRQSVQKQIEDSPFSWREIINLKVGKAPIKPKYQSKTNPKDTWTGRGRKPKWVEDFLAAGGDLGTLSVDSPKAKDKPDNGFGG